MGVNRTDAEKEPRRCFIFSAGNLYHSSLRELPRRPVDYVIAADAGFLLCKERNLVPDLIIGDFDSMEQPVGLSTVTVRRVPVEKDDTDTMLAVKAGLEAGCTVFHLYGCTGGRRLDHTLANFQALLYLRRRGARGFLYGDAFVWTVIEGETLTIRREIPWALLSLFPLDGRAEGVTASGVQYPVRDGVLNPAFPLGVSNHIIEDEAVVAVERGALLAGWQTAAGL
ncbi:MAG: thiamine diphosphokinase [Oscillibacter sp.]|nr:thiamine diphosphokinase [Oscillibacter sp.]